MANYKETLQNNNTDLQGILSTIDSLPEAITPETPTISVSSSGLITAEANDLSATKQLTTQAAKTVTPSISNQTAVASGVYTTGAVTIKGDSNLKAENIAEGVSIFGVAGALTAGYDYELVTSSANSSVTGTTYTYTSSLSSITEVIATFNSAPDTSSTAIAGFTKTYFITYTNLNNNVVLKTAKYGSYTTQSSGIITLTISGGTVTLTSSGYNYRKCGLKILFVGKA